MTTDPKRSPIAALAQTLRNGAAQLREKAATEKSRNMRLQLANSAVMLDDLAARIEAAIAAQVEADWTPVAQRPEASGWYLVWAPKVMVKAGRYFFDGTGFINTTQGQHAELITHWRELPEGPKP